MKKKVLIALLLFLISGRVAIALDMKIQPNSSGRILVENEQYYSKISCKMLFRESAETVRKSIERLVRNLDNNGNYRKGRYSIELTPNNEIFHGVIIASGGLEEANDITGFLNAQKKLSNYISFVPLYYGKMQSSGLRRRLVDHRDWSDVCDGAGTFIVGGRDVYMIPIFMYSDVSGGSSFIQSFVDAVKSIVPSVSTVLFDANFSVEFNEDLNEDTAEIKTLIDNLVAKFAGPRSKVTVQNPVRLKTGNNVVTTSISRFAVEVTKDPDFLLGRAPFRKDYKEAFGQSKPSSLTLAVSDPKKLAKLCYEYSEALFNSGLTSYLDRAYILHQEMTTQQRSVLDTYYCLRGASREVVEAAVLSKKPAKGMRSSPHSIFYGKDLSREITRAELDLFLREYNRVFELERPEEVFDASDKAAFENRFSDLLESGFYYVSNSNNGDQLSANLKQNLTRLFWPSVGLVNQTRNAQLLDGIVDSSGHADMFDAAKFLAISFRDNTCLYTNEDLSVAGLNDDRSKRRVLRDADYGLASYHLEDEEETKKREESGKKAESAINFRLFFSPEAGHFKISNIVISPMDRDLATRLTYCFE
nr:hypothetical protein [uncultured Cohaesibacter sp.]